MLGSELFPALRVGEDGYFPMQHDGCNCGIGICATIGIVLRDFLPQMMISYLMFFFPKPTCPCSIVKRVVSIFVICRLL